MDRQPLLESAQVCFPPGFAGRLERLVARLGAEGERGAARLGGRHDPAGDEFAGFRPYRSGEDVRHLDWSLLARLDQPFVRVLTRPAGERWRIVLDASGSMGLGAPGKLSFAAQLAVAVAALARRAGARCSLLIARRPGRPLRLEFARRGDLPVWMAALGELRSLPDTPDARAALSAPAGAGERVARLFLLSDLQGLEPARALALRRPGRRVHVVQILAPHEREMPPMQAARLVDRERGGELAVQLDGSTRARYAARLGAQVEGWRRLAQRADFAFSSWSSAAPFEDAARALVGT